MSRSHVSILQELMVQQKKLPNYVIENCNDVIGYPFKCTVTIDNICVYAYGPNKKEAKQNTAKKALEVMGYKIQNKLVAPPSTNVTFAAYPIPQRNAPFINYVGKLNEYASTHGKVYPTYVDNVVAINGGFMTCCNFLNLTTQGFGPKKKDSKQDAAKKMLEKLKTEDITVTITQTIASLHVDKIKRVDDLSEILEKYENMVSLSKKKIDVEVKPIPNLKISVNSFEELERELLKYNLRYKIETFQRRPYIMMMKFNGSTVTIMGKGETETEALTDLYQTALIMFSHDFTW